MGCELSDNIADACALVEAMAGADFEAAECLLQLGCPTGVASVLAGWLACAMARLDIESADVIRAGWRARAAELRERAC